MKKQFVVIALIAFFSLFMSVDTNAQGRGHYRYHPREQKRVAKAYRHGYYEGVRHGRHYDRRRGYYASRPAPRYYNHPRYRHGRRYYAPRPHPRAGVSINIPLPPHPPLPPRP